MLPERLWNPAGEFVQFSRAAFHSLLGNIAQPSRQECTVSPAVLHSLPSSIAQSLWQYCTVFRQHCIVSLTVFQSPWQHSTVSCAMLLWRLCSAAAETVQCCCEDCAMLLGRLAILLRRLCNAVMETGQYCWGDCGMLPGRLCNPVG